MRVRSLLTALGLNAIPAAGWFFGDWSAGTTLILYWFETLLGTLLVAARILLHRRLRPSKGHSNYQAPQTKGTPGQGSYLSAFLVPALVFTWPTESSSAPSASWRSRTTSPPKPRSSADLYSLGWPVSPPFKVSISALTLSG